MSDTPLSPDYNQDDSFNKANENYKDRFASLNDAENNPGVDSDEIQDDNPLSDEGGDWEQNYTKEDGAVKSGAKTVAKATLKKSGIPIGIVGLVAVIIAVFGSFLPASFVLLNLGESSVVNRDTTSPILRKRFDKVLDRKLNSVATSGVCTPISANCRFSRLSNNFIKTLDSAGIKAYNGSTLIEPGDGGFLGTKPTHYEFEGKRISAAEFVKEKNTNSKLKQAFHRAYNARFLAMTNSTVKKLFFKKLNLDQSGEGTRAIDPEERSKSLGAVGDKTSKNTISGVENKASAAESAIKEGIEKETKKSLKTVGKANSGVEVAALSGCIVSSAPGIYVNISRLYQMRQEIAIASTVVLTGYSLIKNGNMDAKTMSNLGSMLTETTTDAEGKKTSAMDAFAIKSILFGDTGSKDKSYEKLIPGKTAMDSTKGITNITESTVAKETCKAAMGPAGTAAFAGVRLASCGATLGVGCIVDAAISALLIAGDLTGVTSKAIEAMSPFIAEAATAVITGLPPETIAAAFGNQDITNAKGKQFGEVLGMGLSHFFPSMLLSTGGGALTTSQVASYDTLMNETIAEYAEEERATRSPLDPSSPYTFLGGIVSNFYKAAYSAGDSRGSIISGFNYLLSQPARVASGGTTVNAKPGLSAAQCNNGPDFGVSEDVCIGPFGEVYAGIPAEYLNVSNETLVNSVSDELESSGEIKSSGKIQEWRDSCADGSLFNVEGCVINSQESANLSIYQYDLILADGFDEGFDNGFNEKTATGSGEWTHPLGREADWDTYNSGSHAKGGIDTSVGIKQGDPVYAAGSGTVIASGDMDSYGYAITIQHTDGTATHYAHFVSPSPLNVGDSVSAGDQIGMVGSTGRSSGNHLHFETRTSPSWDSIVPAYPFMMERGVNLGTCTPKSWSEGPCSLGGW